MTPNMKSKTKVKMMLMKLDPPPSPDKRRRAQRNHVEIENESQDDVNGIGTPWQKEEGTKGMTSNMKSKTHITMMLTKLDTPKKGKNKRNDVKHEIENESKDAVNEIGTLP